MFIKIYKEIKAKIINNKDELCLYLKMLLTYLPLFPLYVITSFANYDVLLSMGSSDFNITQVIAPFYLFLISILLTVFFKITALESYMFRKEKLSRQEII